MDDQEAKRPILADPATPQDPDQHLAGLVLRATRHLPHEDYEDEGPTDSVEPKRIINTEEVLRRYDEDLRDIYERVFFADEE